MPEPQVDLVECPICMCEAPASTMFNWGCEGQHQLYMCIAEGTEKCALEEVKAAIETREAPACPMCVMENPEGDATMERTKLRNLVGPQSDLWKRFTALESQGYFARDRKNWSPCPDCEHLLFYDNPGAKVELRCDRDGGCGGSFCSLCRGMYHGNATCEQARQITANWLDWIANGRAQYAAQLVAELRLHLAFACHDRVGCESFLKPLALEVIELIGQHITIVGHEAAQANAAARAEAAMRLQFLRQDEEFL